MPKCLVLFVSARSLKLLGSVWSLVSGCESRVVEPSDVRLPDGEFSEVCVVADAGEPLHSVLGVYEAARRRYGGARVSIIVERGSEAEPVADVVVDPGRRVGEGRLCLVVSGFPGVGKTSFVRGLARVSRVECVYRWGRVLQRVFELGAFGEKLAEREAEDPYYTVVRAYPVLESMLEECGGDKLILDGVKTPAQVHGLAYALGVKPLVLFTELKDPELRKLILMTRSEADDVNVEARDEMLCRLGLCRLRDMAATVYLDARTLEEAIPDERVRRLLREWLNLDGMLLRGRFNPYGDKRSLLDSYSKLVSEYRGAKPTSLDAAERVLEKLGRDGYTMEHVVERLESRLGRLPDWLRRTILYLYTGASIIEDILYEAVARPVGGRLVETPWWRHSIHHAVTYATVLTVAGLKLLQLKGLEPVAEKWSSVLLDALRNIVSSGDGWRGRLIQWLSSAEKLAVAYAVAAEALGRDWRTWFIEGIIEKLREDLSTQGRAGWPTARDVFSDPVAALEVLEELKSRVTTLVGKDPNEYNIAVLKLYVLAALVAAAGAPAAGSRAKLAA